MGLLATVFWPNSSHGTDCILQQAIGIESVCKNRQAGTETAQAMLTFVLWPGPSPFSVNPSSPHSEKVQMAAAPELQTITAAKIWNIQHSRALRHHLKWSPWAVRAAVTTTLTTKPWVPRAAPCPAPMQMKGYFC